MMPPLPLVILILVLAAIMCRQWIPGSPSIGILMISGAVAALLSRQISWLNALHAISFEVMGYLFGVLIIAEALERSGVLENLTDRLFDRCHTGQHALLIIVFILGLSSALLMNDTVAIIGTPIILQLCRKQPRLITPLLLALAYSITIGSVFSPVGNPQNLLIAVHGDLVTPFVSFFKTLIIPTIINLILTALILWKLYNKVLKQPIEAVTPITISDRRTAALSIVSVALMTLLILFKIIIDNTRIWNVDIDFSSIALISALPIIIGSRQRITVVRKIDWGVLLFFIGMFILMRSVWDTGIVQAAIEHAHIAVDNIANVLLISTVLSQVISNVPLVALYLPLLHNVGAHVSAYLALAAGSTVAGNLFVFGAASNIIIVQNAEKRAKTAFSFWRFSAIGVVITLINILVYAVFIG